MGCGTLRGLGIGAPIVQVYHEKSVILPDVSRVLACLYEKKVDFQAHTASYKSLLRLQASSHAPVPFYDGPTFLEESREICRYIAEKYEHQGYPFLLGKDALERASVEQWLHNEEHAFNPPSRALFCHLAFPLGEEEDDDIDIHTRKLEEVLEVYEQRLSDSEFLVGNKFTLADLVHLPNSHYIKASNKFLYLYDSRKNVRRWWDAICNRDSWKKVLRYMEDVEEQNKQEELKKQKQQEEDPRTSADPIRVYSRKQTRTEPRTILVPPDTMSSSSTIPQTKKPLPSDTDQPGASDFYKRDSTATSVDSQFKEVSYPGRTPPELEPTDTSSSKLHTTDVHPRLQVEQWHAATTGLNDLKHDAGHLMPTQQGKPRKDVQQYPSQDSEQATTPPVPQEPTGMELVQGREMATRRPYTDQSRDVLSPLPQQTTGTREIVEDYATDQRGAVLPPSTQEHGATQRQAAAKDARSRISSQAAYPGVQDTRKQPRDRGSVPRQGEAQDARDRFDDSDAADSTISTERFSYTSQSSLPRQDLDGARHATAPFETRYPGVEDTYKQAKDKISTPWQMADHDAGDITEETKISESSSFRVLPSHFDRADTPSWKQETVDDTFKETESGDPSFLRDQQSGTWQTASTSAEQEVNLGGHSVVPPSQTRYQSLTPPSKTRYPVAKDASKQPRGTVPTLKKKAARDDNDTSEESKTADEVASTEQLLDARRAPSPRRTKDEDSTTADTSFQKRYPYDEEDIQVANTAVSPQITPGGDKNIFEEIKLPDFTPSAKPVRTHRAPVAPPRQAEVKEAKDKGRQSGVTIPEPQKLVSRDDQASEATHGERETGLPGEQSSDRLQAIPQLRPPAAEGTHRATGETIQFPDILDTTKKSRGTFEETKGPGFTLPRAQSLGAQDAQRTSGEARIPTKNERKDVSTQLHPDAEDSFQQSKSSPIDRKSLGSLSSQERDVKDVQATRSEEQTVSTEELREITKKSESQGSIKVVKTKPPFAQDKQEQSQIQAGEKRDGSIPKHQRASDAPYVLNEKLSTTAPSKAKTHDDSGTKEPHKKGTANEQIEVPPLLSNEPTSQVHPTSLQGVASHGGLSTKSSKIEQWQRASVPLNDLTSRSGVDEIGMATIDQKLAPTSQQATPSSEDVNQMAKESVEQRVEPPVQIETEIPAVQSASSSFPGPSAAHHATSADKIARQSIIDKRIGEPTKIPPLPDSSPAHTKRETPDGHEIVGSELVSTPDGHISEAAKIRHDQATVHEDVHHVSTHDVAKDTFKKAKVAESIPSSAKPMYPQRPDPTPRLAEVEDTWDKGTKGRESVPDQQKIVEKWAGTAREQVSDRWKPIPPSRQAAAEEVRGATSDTIQSPDVLDTSKKSRGAYEKAKVSSSVQEQEKSSVYQKEPLVAQDSQEQAQTTPAGDKADGSTRKHQKTSDAPDTFVEKLNASEPARVKSHGDFSLEESYRKETTDDLKVAPPLLTRDLTSQDQPPSEPSYDAALHGDLSNNPSTIYQWQRASAPLRGVTTSSGDDEVTSPTVDEKPTPMSQQKSDEQRAERPVPIETELSGVQHASPSFPGASEDDHASIDDKFAKQSIIDERVGELTQMQTSSPDAHPASEPKRETPEGHEIGDLEIVSTPGGKISEAKQTRDDPARIHEDVYDVNLSTQDVGKDAFKETNVAYYTPSSAQPMHIQQPALTPSRQTQIEEASDKSMQSRETIPEQQKVVERKKDIPGEQLSDHQKAIRPSRQPAAEDAPIGDTIQSSDILDTPKKSRRTFEEAIGPGSTLPKAQVLDAQDSQLTKGESTVPATDQRKDWKYAKDDETIMAEENSLSTERLRKMFQESASTTPKTQLTNSEGSNELEKTSSKGPLAAQEESQIIPADEKVDGSTSEHHESSGVPYTYDEKLSASAPARADIHDDHSAEEQYKKYLADDQKVSPSLSSKKPASQAQLASEPLQRAVPDGDFPSKSFTIDQWQRTSVPLHGVITDSGDAHTGDLGKTELAKPTVTDQEATMPVADPTSMAPQRAGIVPAEVAHSEQKSTLSDEGSTHAAQPLSPVEPIKTDSNVSAANYTDAPQMIFRQQTRPSAPSTIGIPASDTQGVMGNIQEVTPDSRHTDDSGNPFVPTQEHVSHASQTIPGQEEVTTPPGTQVFPTSDTQLASAEVHEVTPDDQQTVESNTPLVSSGKQGSHVRSPFELGEVDPVEKKFSPSDHKSPFSSDQSISGEPRKEQTDIPTAEQTKAPPTIIGRQDIPDRKQALTSEDMLDTGATLGDVHRTGTIEPPRRPLSVEGEEPSSATQASSPRVARDSLYTELENVQPVKSSRTPDAHDITPSEVALAEQKSAASGQGSADPAQPAFSLDPRNEEIRDLTPTAKISSTDPNKGDAIVAIRDQAKDSQTTPGPRDLLPAGYPSGKVQENITSDDLGKAKPSRPSSAVQEGKPSKASVSGIQLGSVPNEVSVDEQKFAPPGQDSAYLARPPSSAEPRSKEIGDLAPSTHLNSTTVPRNEGAIVAAADEATDSQATSGRQATFSAPSSYTQGPSGKLQEDEPANNLDVAKSSKLPSVVHEGKSAAAVPISALDTRHGAAPDLAVAQKYASSGQDSVHSVQKSFSTEPTKEDTVVAATDQTSTLERTVDQDYMTPAADKAKPPFSGTPDASRKTQKSTEDDHIDEKLPSQGRVSPDRHVSESPQGFTPDAPSDVVDKETTLGSNHAETSNTGPDSTPIKGDAHLSSGGMAAASSLRETQGLQNSASAQNVLSDSLGKIKSPGHLSTDQAMALIMSPSIPSVAPLGTVPGTISVQPPQKASKASTVNLESVPDTPQGKTTPAEQKSAGSDQEPAHTTEHHFSPEPRKEEANTAAIDQPKVPQGPETTVRHQAPPDSREALQKYQQPSLAVLPSDIGDGPPPGLQSTVVDKETTQTSVTEPTSTPTRGYVHPTRSVQNQEAEPPAATQAPTSEGLQDTSISQNDPFANTKSPRQFSTDQTKAPVISSPAPPGAPEVTEPGPNYFQSIQPPLSTEPTKEDTVVTAADQSEDMQTVTHQQAILAPLLGTQDASRKYQGSIPDDGRIDETLPSKEHVPRQGSSSEPREGQTSDPYGTNIDEKTTTFPSSLANISESRSDLAPTLGEVIPSISEGRAANYSPTPAAQTQLPEATEDVPPYASSKTKSTGQGAMPSAGYQASSPDTRLGSPQTLGEASPADQKFAVSDKEPSNASKSLASPETRKEDTGVATTDQANVPLTNVSDQVTRSTEDASDALSRDQQSSPLDNQIKYLGNPPTADQEDASRAGRDSKGSTPEAHRAIVDDKTTLPSSQAQTSSTWPDSTPISGDPRLSSAGVPATSSVKKQETEPSAATKAPTSVGLQRSVFAQNDSFGNIESPTQVSTNQTAAPAISSAAPSGAPEVTEPGPNSSQSVQPPLSTEASKEDTVVSAADQSKDMQTVTHEQAILAPDTVKPPFLGTQDASRKYQGSIPDDGRIDETLPSKEHVPRQGSSSELREGQTSDPYGTNIDEKTTTFPSSRANISESKSDLAPTLGEVIPSFSEGPAANYSPTPRAETQLPAATQDVSPYASSKAKSTGQGAKPSAGYQASSPETQLGSPQTLGEASPADQKFAVSDKEPSNASKSLASPETRKEDTDVATTNQANVPLTNGSHQVTRSTQDASDALSSDQQSSPLDNQIKYLGNPPTAYQEEASRAGRDSKGSTPEAHRAVVDDKTALPSSQAQTSSTWPDSTPISGDPHLSSAGVPATSSIKIQETEPPAATKAPTSVGLQRSVFAQNDSFGNIESPTQVSTNQTAAPAISSAAPSGAPEVTEPGPNSSQSVQPPLSTEASKEDTVVSAADQSKDMQTVTHEQAILAPDTVKPPFLGTQDASRKSQGSIPDDGRIDGTLPSKEHVPRQGSSSELREGQTSDPYGTNIDEKTTTFPSSRANISESRSDLAPTLGEVIPSISEGPVANYSPTPGAQTQLPAATQDVSLYASSKAKSTGQGAKPSAGYQASSPDTQLGSPQTQGEASPEDQKFAVSDKESANASKSLASAGTRKEDTDAALANQASVPLTNVSHQVTRSTQDASDALSRDQQSSPLDNQIKYLGNQPTAYQEEASRAGRDSKGSTPEAHRAIVDDKTTLPSSQAQTSSTWPDSTPISGDPRLSSAGVPATSSIKKQETEPPAATKSPTSVGLQRSVFAQNDSFGNIESPTQVSTNQTAAPAISSAAPSGAPEGPEPGPKSSQSVQLPLSTEPTKEDTNVTAADQTEDMQTVTHQQAIVAPDTVKPPSLGTQDASRNYLENIPDNGRIDESLPSKEHVPRQGSSSGPLDGQSKVQLQSEDKTQGREVDASSSETGRPSKGDFLANSYQNDSSQSQEEASNKSVEQSSDIQNKDNDSGRLDDSDQSHQVGDSKN